MEATNVFNADSNANIVSNDDDFFGGSAQTDIFGTVEDVKQPKVEKAEQKIEKDLVQQHNEENATMNGFDAGFDDNFGNFDTNKDLDIAQQNVETDKNGGGGGDDWNTNFDDQEPFGSNEDNKETQTQNEEDVDNLFAESAANDIFGTPNANTNTNADTFGNGAADDLFSNNFGNDDIFGNSEPMNVEKHEDKSSNIENDDMFGTDGQNVDGFAFDATGADLNMNSDDGALFDDEFDDEQAIEFPEFDINETTTTKTKKSKKKKEKTLQAIDANALGTESSPQPNQITAIPEPVISFDAQFDDNNNYTNGNNKTINEEEPDDDNPFGDDPFGGDAPIDDDDDDDVIDEDNPFAVFDESDGDNNNTNDAKLGDDND